LAGKKQAVLHQIAQLEAEIAGREAAAVARAQAVFGSTFIGVIDRAIKQLNDLLSHPLDVKDNLQDVLALLEEAEVGFVTLVTPAMSQACSEIQADTELPMQLVHEVEKDAQRAEQIVETLRKMASMQSETERAAFALKIDDAPTKKSVSLRAFNTHASPHAMTTLSKAFTSRSKKIKGGIVSFLDTAPQDTSAYRLKIASDLDRYFKGVPVAAARQKRAQLLAEAKVRYAKDPATLKALETYLRDEAHARGVD